MKTLEKLSNVDKADLLFSLFPQEIPALVDFIGGMAESILEDGDKGRANWSNGLFTFDFWLRLVKDADSSIKRYGTKLHKQKRLFTDQLFDGYTACFTCYCIEVYIQTKQHNNKRFVFAAQMLFNV